jgi:thymidylate synthase (FAD)
MVNLITHTTFAKHLNLQDARDIDIIVYQARVSNQRNKQNFKTSEKLIRSMIKRSEWSPFEMLNYGFEIYTTRDVTAQMIRHWAIKPQEFSQRYATALSIESIKLTMQDPDGSRHLTFPLPKELYSLEEEFNSKTIELEELYSRAIKLGVSRETARKVLPLATTSIIVLNGSMRSWITYLNVRLKIETQEDHRIIALRIAEIIAERAPEVAAALDNFNDFQGGFLDPVMNDEEYLGMQNFLRRSGYTIIREKQPNSGEIIKALFKSGEVMMSVKYEPEIKKDIIAWRYY